MDIVTTKCVGHAAVLWPGKNGLTNKKPWCIRMCGLKLDRLWHCRLRMALRASIRTDLLLVTMRMCVHVVFMTFHFISKFMACGSTIVQEHGYRSRGGILMLQV